MKKGTVMTVVSIVSLLFAGLLLITCGSDDDEKIPMSQIGPGAFAIDYATSGDYFTKMGGMLTGNSPHGQVQIWYSNNVKDLIAKDSFIVPEGTVSIKSFDTEGDGILDGLAVMIKKEAGYDTANNDWYYEMRSTEGALSNTPAPGRIPSCISCHQKWEAKDYLAGTELTLYDGPGAFAADFESSSEFFTNMGGMIEGNSPHGLVQIWYSKNVQDLIAKDSFVVPQGTVAIKKFDSDKDDTIDGLVVMVKREAGYDTENNNWYYAMHSTDGKLLDTPAPGKIQSCIDCHGFWADKDYLGGTDLK